jgi:hypothetical protein
VKPWDSKTTSFECDLGGIGIVFVFLLIFGIGSCVREQDTRQAIDKLSYELEIQRQVNNRAK